MTGDSKFYAGADYGLDPSYGDNFLNMNYRIPVSQFGFPSNPQTANQIKAVSDKISTGAKVIEVSGVNIGGGEGPLGLIDNIPIQHFKEINRLKKLAGVELTFHGPLVEPTGISRDKWEETDRLQAERQILSAVERGHQLDPEGNIVITFHTSAALPELLSRTKGKNGEEQ